MTPVLTEVPTGPRSHKRFRQVLDQDHYEEFESAMKRVAELLRGRVFWHVNSTARGGGVAEMLNSLIPYLRSAGVDARWVVIEGNEAFFRVTKRIHNNLHGELGDEGPLDDEQERVYRDTLRSNARELTYRLNEGDVVLLHDPQTAGLVGSVREAGGLAIWRCHVGLDTPNARARRAWDFLRPHVIEAHAFVFSRRVFAWEGLPDDRISVIPPSIDPFSPKNQDIDPESARAILSVAALVDDKVDSSSGRFIRTDGSRGMVERRAELIDGRPPPPPDASLVVQVSRWDRLKDPTGVVEGFARYVSGHSDAHLVVAGPAVDKVADDPEGAGVLEAIRRLWADLPVETQDKVHLAALPMDDPEENAAIVNALQRRADVIVQKSLAEGFGLTVSEAMWKSRPLVASRVGGIQDQVDDGESGILIPNPSDLQTFGKAVLRLLDDRDLATAMGERARERVRRDFLDPRQLIRHADLIEQLLGGD